VSKLLGAVFILAGLFLLFMAFMASEKDIYSFVIAPLKKPISTYHARFSLALLGVACLLSGYGFSVNKLAYVGFGILIMLITFLSILL
jgi:hypothetical protein